jgi:hypothetical protein
MIVSGDPEVDTDGLGMSDMREAVRFWRKTGSDLFILTRLEILFDDPA